MGSQKHVSDESQENPNSSATKTPDPLDSKSSIESSTDSSEDWFINDTEEMLGTSFGITRGCRDVRPRDMERQ